MEYPYMRCLPVEGMLMPSSDVTGRDSRTAGEAAQLPPPPITVSELRKFFPVKGGVFQGITGHVRAIDGVSLEIRPGETLGLVGESGCGKTTFGRCIAGLTRPTTGGVYFQLGARTRVRFSELLAIPHEERSREQHKELDRIERAHRTDRLDRASWRLYRRNCQVVFQDPLGSLNPRQLVKDVVARPLKVHREARGSELIDRVADLLDSVGLGSQHLYRYPHQLSGGERQRVSIARALALDPDFIVLDEPTSALDVSVQAQILNLLHQLQQERGLTYLFISHDMGVVRLMSDRIAVMYAGEVVEHGPATEIVESPLHPYTKALLTATPDLPEKESLGLEGSVPDPAKPPEGCRLHTRCPLVTPECGWEIDDVVREITDGLDELVSVRRRSPFHGEFVFSTTEAAGYFLSRLDEDLPLSARAALVEREQAGAIVYLAFPRANRVTLETVDSDHATSCILHTSKGEGPTRQLMGDSEK